MSRIEEVALSIVGRLHLNPSSDEYHTIMMVLGGLPEFRKQKQPEDFDKAHNQEGSISEDRLDRIASTQERILEAIDRLAAQMKGSSLHDQVAASMMHVSRLPDAGPAHGSKAKDKEDKSIRRSKRIAELARAHCWGSEGNADLRDEWNDLLAGKI